MASTLPRFVLCAFAALPAIASPSRAQSCADAGGGCGTSPSWISICQGSPTVGNASFAIDPDPCLSFCPNATILLLGVCGAPISIPSPPACSGPCTLGVNPILFAFVNLSPVPLPIPLDPSLVGSTVCAQTICILFAFPTLCPVTCGNLSKTLAVTVR